MHGNAIKLMFMLVKHGIAHITTEDYTHLVDIYCLKPHELDKNKLAQFETILSRIKFHSKILVRLIGDELADRGSNDYFTLKILEKLHQHHVPVEINISNHGMEFIQWFEQGPNYSRLLDIPYTYSMYALHSLIENNLISRDVIHHIVERHYKPYLRTVSYSLNANKTEITLFSHAGIGLEAIKAIATKFAVNYEDATITKLAATIDAINEKFQQHLKKNTVHTLVDGHHVLESHNANIPIPLENAPLEYLLWNRCYDNISRPTEQHGYRLYFVHGHDSSEISRNNIYNLDNLLGKSIVHNQEIYTVFYAPQCSHTQSQISTGFFADVKTARLMGLGIGSFVWGGIATAIILNVGNSLLFIIMIETISALLIVLSAEIAEKLVSPTIQIP